MERLGDQIRALRRKRDITQTELAHGLVTPGMISQIESGRSAPSIKLLTDIAERLGVDISELNYAPNVRSDKSSPYRLGRFAMDEREYNLAIEYFEETLTLPLSPTLREETILGEIAECQENLGNLQKSYEAYERIIVFAYEHDDIATAVHAYYQQGHLQRRMNRPAIARMYWQRASDLLDRNPQLKMPIAMKVLFNLGKIYYYFKQYSRALHTYQKAEILAQEFSATLEQANIQHGIGNVYVRIGSFVEAEQHTKLALNLYRVAKHQRGVHQCQINMALVLRKQGKLQEATDYILECMQNREFQQDSIRLDNALSELAKCKMELKQYQGALDDAKHAHQSFKDHNFQSELYCIEAACHYYLKQYPDVLNAVAAGIAHATETDKLEDITKLRRFEQLAYAGLHNVEEVIHSAQQLVSVSQTILNT